MKMITVKLQGKEVQAALLDPKIVKKCEDGFDATLVKFNEATKCKKGSDGIRMQCQSVIDYVTDIFGEHAAKEVFGEETDLLTCMDVLEEMQKLYKEQVTPLINEKKERLEREIGTEKEE